MSVLYIRNSTGGFVPIPTIKGEHGEGFLTPEMYGAVGDGVADDTQAIQSALDNNDVVCLKKTYKITQPLIINKSKTIYGEGQATIINGGEYAFIISNKAPDVVKLDNFVIQDGRGIKVQGPNVNISNITFIDVEYCVDVPESNNAYECVISHCHAYGNDVLLEVGYNIEHSDAMLEYLTMKNYKYPFIIKGGHTRLDHVHPWIDAGIDNHDSVFATLNGGSLFVLNSCLDGYDTAFKFNTYAMLNCTGCNATYSEYTWNDAERIPVLLSNPSTSYPQVYFSNNSFMNTTGSKTLVPYVGNFVIHADNTRINDDLCYKQTYTDGNMVAKTNSTGTFIFEECKTIRNGDSFDMEIKAIAQRTVAPPGVVFAYWGKANLDMGYVSGNALVEHVVTDETTGEITKTYEVHPVYTYYDDSKGLQRIYLKNTSSINKNDVVYIKLNGS